MYILRLKFWNNNVIFSILATSLAARCNRSINSRLRSAWNLKFVTERSSYYSSQSRELVNNHWEGVQQMICFLLLNLTQYFKIFFWLFKVFVYSLFHIIEVCIMLLLSFLKLLHLFIYVLIKSIIFHLSSFILPFESLCFCSILH